MVEAAEQSGSLITTEFARTSGGSWARCRAGPWERARGSNALLRAGAVVITRTEDVLDELYGVGVRPRPAAAAEGPIGRGRSDASEGAVAAEADVVLAAIEAGGGVDGRARPVASRPRRSGRSWRGWRIPAACGAMCWAHT